MTPSYRFMLSVGRACLPVAKVLVWGLFWAIIGVVCLWESVVFGLAMFLDGWEHIGLSAGFHRFGPAFKWQVRDSYRRLTSGLR